MAQQRIFRSDEFMQPADGEPIRSVISESEHATLVAWHVKPGQRIKSHVHPKGQDTWTILAGQGQYQLTSMGEPCRIKTGDVVVAPAGCLHGVYNDGPEPLRFISVVCPLEAGFQLA